MATSLQADIPHGRWSRGFALWSVSIAALALVLGGGLGNRAYADPDYQLGHGLDVGPFNFAGYGNVLGGLADTGHDAVSLEDFSLFVSGHLGRLVNPFVEAELTNLDVASKGPARLKGSDADFVLERLYNDAYLTDELTLRLGKFLSPVGAWNEIHAAPLVLTAFRPAVTNRNFSEYTTGLSLNYSNPEAGFVDVKLYWQPTSELAERPSDLTFHQYKTLEGAQVSFPIGLLDKIGVSFQHSRDINGVEQSLYGVDYHYTIGKLTFQGEGTFSDIAGSNIPGNAVTHGRDSEWGAYAAASYAFTDEWAVQGWYEGFADRAAPATARDVLVGFSYRPVPALVFRGEYLLNVGGPPVNPTGLLASFSVLF